MLAQDAPLLAPTCAEPTRPRLTSGLGEAEEGTLCPEQICEINRTTSPGYSGTLLEQYGFVLSKSGK